MASLHLAYTIPGIGPLALPRKKLDSSLCPLMIRKKVTHILHSFNLSSLWLTVNDRNLQREMAILSSLVNRRQISTAHVASILMGYPNDPACVHRH